MAIFRWNKDYLIFECFSGETLTATLLMEDKTYESAVPSQDWIQVEGADYTAEGDLEFTLSCKSDPGASRIGLFTAIASDGTKVALKITQREAKIEVTPTNINFLGYGGEKSVKIKSTAGWTVASTTNKFFSYNPQGMDTLVVSAEKNVSGADRSGTIIVKATAYDRAEALITVNQSQYQGTVIDLGKIEIWKDNVIEYATEKSVVDYAIQVDGKKIYEGKAYKLPGDTVVRVIPNRIVENYLYAEADFNKIKAGNINQVESTQLRDIRVKIDFDDYIYKAFNNWSYNSAYDLNNAVNFNFPVLTKADSRQFCPETNLVNGVLTTVWKKLKDSTIYTQAPEDCQKRYVLYYNNLYSGWDALLFSGKYTRSEKLNRSTSKYATLNTSGQHYSRQWNINITESWKLKSYYLNEDECKRMENVLTSNLVFLHDLDSDIIYPVNVTDTSYTEKNRYDKRRQRYYEINVERAIDMNRK